MYSVEKKYHIKLMSSLLHITLKTNLLVGDCSIFNINCMQKHDSYALGFIHLKVKKMLGIYFVIFFNSADQLV